MGLSEFQKKKFLHVFKTFYDENSDGKIDWADFEADLKKVSKVLGWKEGEPKYEEAKKTLKTVWESLVAAADLDKNKAITTDEWLTMWEKVIAQPTLPAWITEFQKFMFTFTDSDGDNYIDLNEYKKVFTHYGLSEADCETAFNTVTNNGAIKLTLEEYQKCWKEFFTSSDEKSKGNALFGKF